MQSAAILFALFTLSASTMGQRQGQLRLPEIDQRALAGINLFFQNGTEPARPFPFTIEGSEKRLVRFACEDGEYFVVSHHVVSAPMRLNVTTCATPQPVSLYPVAHVTGRVTGLAASTGHRSLALVVRTCSTDQNQATIGRYNLAVGAGGAFAAAVPADCLDLSIAGEGLAPAILPRLAFSLGQRVDVGSIALRPSAALEVTVRRDQRLQSVITIDLNSREQLAQTLESLLGGKTPSATAHTRHATGDRLLYRDLRPEIMYVVARGADRIGIAGPLELKSGETTRTAVALNRPVTARVAVSGDRSWLSRGSRLAARLTPRVAGRWFPAAHIRVPIDDAAPTAFQLPLRGLWRAQLYLEGQTSATLIDDRTVQIGEDEPATVEFLLGRVTFPGTLYVGGATKAGTMRIRGRGIPEVEVRVDNEGTFRAPLPGPGEYRVEFQAADGGTRGTTKSDFIDPAIPALIRLTVATISGTVVHANGTAAPQVRASAKLAVLTDLDAVQSAPISTLTDADGRFSLTVGDDGDWEIRAESKGQVAEPQMVFVSGRDVRNVRLVLEESSQVQGRVTDALGQPVPGASGALFTEATAPGQVPPVHAFTTDMQGYFRTRLDRPIRRAIHVIVTAPGRPTAAYRLTTLGQPLNLIMPILGGEARVTFPSTNETVSGLPKDLHLYVLINDQGAVVTLPTLLDKRAGAVIQSASGATLVIPSLAPGNWRLTKFSDLRQSLLFVSGTGEPATVARLTITPGGSASADVR